MGCMVGAGRIVGAMVGSISGESDWEATRNETPARYAHLALERARANASVKAHRTGHRQPREPGVAFAHQRLEAVNADPKGKSAME